MDPTVDFLFACPGIAAALTELRMVEVDVMVVGNGKCSAINGRKDSLLFQNGKLIVFSSQV
jgi:hypothetical protein